MLELGDQIGKVSKGLSLEEINRVLKKCLFFKGKMGKNQERFNFFFLKQKHFKIFF